MYEVTVVEHVSLDGVMQAPGTPEEDTRGGFELGGWAARRLAADPEAAQAAMAGQGDTQRLLFGRRTYHELVGYWLNAEPNPFAEILATTPKYVATHNPDVDLPYPNSTALLGDAATTVRALKDRGDGDLVVLGSGVLVRHLIAAGLVDRFVLTTIPVVLGRGTKLFDHTYLDLDVQTSAVSPTGIVTATYEVRDAGGSDRQRLDPVGGRTYGGSRPPDG